MFRVTAESVVTQVVYLHLTRDVSVIMGIGHDVGSGGNTIHENTSVLSSASIAREGASPVMTQARLSINDIAHIRYLDTGKQTLNECLPAVLFNHNDYQLIKHQNKKPQTVLGFS